MRNAESGVARRRLAILFVILAVLAAPGLALAQDEPAGDGEDEEEQAAKHFAAGRKLYGEAKYKEAIEELLKAYNLRPAPPILLNIARTYEKLGDKQNALKFYKEFLQKARLVDPSRPQVEAVVKELEKGVKGKTGALTTATGTETPTATTTTDGGTVPVGKQQMIHTPVDSARVRQPITIMAELPPGVVADRVLCHFRRSGELRFQSIQMEPQGESYVGQIPGNAVISTSLQYYLEAIKGGKSAALAGSKTTPNIIVIEGGHALVPGGREETIRSPYWKWTWVGVGVTAAMLAGAVAFPILAADRQNAIETRATDPDRNCNQACQEGKGTPKIPFDVQARDWESEGQAFAAAGTAFIVLTAVAAGATGALFYLDRRWIKRERAKRAFTEERSGLRFLAAPYAGPGGAGVLGRIDF
jgi:hypothetical protein